MNGQVQVGTQGYIPVDLNTLRIDSVIDFHLYIAVDGDYVLYRAPTLTFTEKARQALIEHGQKFIYIAHRDRKAYQEYIESHLTEIINDKTLGEEVRSSIVYNSARMLVMDLMEKPSLPENLKRSLGLVENTALHLLKSQDAFYHTVMAMPFNYSTYTHSVNVCIFSLALADRVGVNGKAEIHTLGTGALLHDIGKARIPTDIIEKPGTLTNAEMMIVRRHPQYGFEIIINSNVIPHDAHFPILQHHERENGTGYPHALQSKDIHKYSKIVAIADVFDAMTTKRSYREAKDAFPALKEMYDDTGAFDRDLLEEFTRLLGASDVVVKKQQQPDSDGPRQ
jgi:putative nucleotidyltransferase with HDIG domain